MVRAMRRRRRWPGHRGATGWMPRQGSGKRMAVEGLEHRMLFNALAWSSGGTSSGGPQTRLRSISFGSIDVIAERLRAAVVFQHVQLRSVYRYLVDAAFRESRTRRRLGASAP